MSEEWDAARYAREKRDFIASRRRSRSLYLHTALIFTLTWLAGWGASALLLRLGIDSMPLRYALAFGLSYLVFLGGVRVWADFLRTEHGQSLAGDPGVPDLSGLEAEGCGVVLIGLAVGLLLAALLTLMGGVPLLLEVAFEVVFAGVVVRRLGRRHRVGHWVACLLRNTWRPALLSGLLLVALAAWLQHQAPDQRTFAQAVRALR